MERGREKASTAASNGTKAVPFRVSTEKQKKQTHKNTRVSHRETHDVVEVMNDMSFGFYFLKKDGS